MSPSELLRRTGLSVSTRQFRRYITGRLIPGVVRRKRGHYVVVGPVTPARIARIRENIIKFRCKPGRKKLRYFPPVGNEKETLFSGRFPPWNLYTSMISFEWWLNKCDPLHTWSDAKKSEVLKELTLAAAVALRLANDLKQKIRPWDGTKTDLKALRQW